MSDLLFWICLRNGTANKTNMAIPDIPNHKHDDNFRPTYRKHIMHDIYPRMSIHPVAVTYTVFSAAKLSAFKAINKII